MATNGTIVEAISVSSASPSPGVSVSSTSSSTSTSSVSTSPTSSSTSSSSSSTMASSTLTLPSPFPYAAAPDIIRAHQKDTYFAGTLANDLADLLRRLAGGRTAHAWAAETRTAADLVYWGLTTCLGSRTLGEEYCDLVQVVPTAVAVSQAVVPTIATPRRRSAYVLAAALAPYLAGRALPRVRRVLRRRLEAFVEKASSSASTTSSITTTAARYLLAHLDTLTAGTHVRAVTLALFYFYGAYYTLTTRLLGLRYVFTRRRTGAGSGASGDDVVGYEVLGALLVLQMAVQGYLHVRATWTAGLPPAASASVSTAPTSSPPTLPVEVSLSHDHSYTANNELLLSGAEDSVAATAAAAAASPSASAIAALTHTPPPPVDGPRFDLRPAATMAWLSGRVQRQCTLCLEVLRDPSATPCGHVFCWQCIGDWVREKPECPLCRRAAHPQHILPLRAL